MGVVSGTPSRWALSVAREVFESLDDPLVLARVARPYAHVGEAKFLQKLPDIALMELDAEPLGDGALEVHPAPTHDAVLLAIGASLDRDGKLGQLLGRQTGPGTVRPIVDEPIRSGGVEAMDPVAPRLPIHAADLGRRAAIHPVPNRRKATRAVDSG